MGIKTIILTLLWILTVSPALAADYPVPLPEKKPPFHFTTLPVSVSDIEPSSGNAQGEKLRRPDFQALELQIVQHGDMQLSCAGLIAEGRDMTKIMTLSEKQMDTSQMQEKGIGVAGAIGSFLVGSVTGGIGLAAAGFLAKGIPQENAEEADKFRDIAAQRRSVMMGIYKAKQCPQPWPQDLIVDARAELSVPEEPVIHPSKAGLTDQDRYNR